MRFLVSGGARRQFQDLRNALVGLLCLVHALGLDDDRVVSLIFLGYDGRLGEDGAVKAGGAYER